MCGGVVRVKLTLSLLSLSSLSLYLSMQHTTHLVVDPLESLHEEVLVSECNTIRNPAMLQILFEDDTVSMGSAVIAVYFRFEEPEQSVPNHRRVCYGSAQEEASERRVVEDFVL